MRTKPTLLCLVCGIPAGESFLSTPKKPNAGGKSGSCCTGTNYGVAAAQGLNEPMGHGTYGSSCDRAWDIDQKYCMLADVNATTGGTYLYDGTPADWCYLKWCFVSSDTCHGVGEVTEVFYGSMEANAALRKHGLTDSLMWSSDVCLQ